jgi:hypothetical protein
MATEIELFKSPDLTPLEFLLVSLDEERSLEKEGGYTRRIARSNFRCCCPHYETRRSTQTSRDLGARVDKCVEVDDGIF